MRFLKEPIFFVSESNVIIFEKDDDDNRECKKNYIGWAEVNFTRRGMWVCRDEFFSHADKEIFYLIPLCGLEGAQAAGREEKNLRLYLSQRIQHLF